MKKFLSVIAVFGFACSTNAQLVVDSLGRVGIGTETPKESLTIFGSKNDGSVMKLHQNDESTGLRVNSYQHPTYTSSMTGIDVRGLVLKGIDYVGVNSFVKNPFSSPSHSSVGVWGSAIGSQYNYGLLGRVSPSDTASFCAGVCGCASAGMPKFESKGVYAGYFVGRVKVTGKLYGTLYSPTGVSSTSVQTLALSSEDGESVSDKLLSVQTVQFVREEETGQLKPSVSSYNLLTDAKSDDDRLTDEQMQVDSIFEDNADRAWHTEDKPQMETEMVRHYGLDGKQLKAVFPELVAEDTQGNYHINYSEMVPLLLQSIRELSARVEELEGNKGVVVQKSMAMAMPMSVDEAGTATDIMRMSQNKPNPFSESSVITLNVPDGAKAASIYIYDLSGKLLKSISVDQRGETDITVYASDLQEGMFVYSLVVDGTVAATRRMMVVRN